ncbi:MAG: glucose-6-phosphate isomerase [Frankiaceae bacterium]|nr:glucose-6-phosphate isomerase [Frankiaceae bacterium]
MSESLKASGGGVTVTVQGVAVTGPAQSVLDRAVGAGVAKALVSKDATLWGPDASAEASIRLGWLDVVEKSTPLLHALTTLAADLSAKGVDRVVLSGMGGSSLAPEVITLTAGVPLVVVDTTDPHQVASALTDLERTVLVVSSKSGGTIETDSHRRVFEKAFRDAGIDPVERIIVVTDPDSPLDKSAREAGYRVFVADPNIGGRYSALSAFGLVPSALAGADVAQLLADAAAMHATLADDDNPALLLGAALGGGGMAGHDKVVIADNGSGITGFGDWAEQLVAESTGKDGKGLLPVVLESIDGPGFEEAADVHRVVLGPISGGAAIEGTGTAVSGPLGAQFLLWESATAIAGWAIGIDPFNQPNVAEAKAATSAVLDEAAGGALPEGRPLFTDGAVVVYGDGDLLDGVDTLPGVLQRLLTAVPQTGYLAVMAYLDRFADAEAAQIRIAFDERISHPVTFGWGPRFLHSTGQYHKGGPANGVFLQITGVTTTDLDVPGKPYSLGTLQLAQALGDLRTLKAHQLPAVRLHLTDRATGLAQLLAAARSGA